MHMNFAEYLVVAEGHDCQGNDEVAERDQERVRTSFEISRNLGTTLACTLQTNKNKKHQDILNKKLIRNHATVF